MARLGPAASLDPACRLLCLALLSSGALVSGPVFAALLALACLALLIMEGSRPLALAREAAFVLLFTLFAFGIRFAGLSLSADTLGRLAGEAGLYGLRLLAAYLAGRLFYASTSASELRDAATRIARRLPLARRLDIGLGISMVAGFIPLIFEEWRCSLEAARSRGMPRKPSLSRQAQFVSSFLRRLILRAVATPEALLARGWSLGRGTMPSTWKKRDTIASCCSLALLLAGSLGLV